MHLDRYTVLKLLLKACLLSVVLYYWTNIRRVDSDAEPAAIHLPLFGHTKLYQEASAAAAEAIRRARTAPSLQARFLTHVEPVKLHKARKLQEYLDCVVERGSFTRMSVSSPSPYEWIADSSCHDILDVESSVDLCDQLSGKRLLLLGDRVQYSLHHLLLNRLSRPSLGSSYTCSGADFCNWHTLCPHHSVQSPQLPLGPENNEPTSSIHAAPSDSSYHTIMRYVPTDTLYYSDKRGDRRLSDPYISMFTDVRKKESFWRFWVTGSDIIVLSKGPVPAPFWSYSADNPVGVSGVPRRLAPRVGNDHEFSQLFGNISLPSFKSSTVSPLSSTEPYTPAEIISAAVRATLDVWLPTTLRTLTAIREDPGDMTKNKVLVWRGEWFAQGGCDFVGNSMVSAQLDRILGTLLSGKTPHVADPWLAFHNVQVLFQSLFLKDLLPHFDIPYLSHNMHLAPFRTGLVGARRTSGMGRGLGTDCLSYDPSATDRHIDEAFLASLGRALALRNEAEGVGFGVGSG